MQEHALSPSLFGDLERINQRPKPFEWYTARDLWTDDHTSKQMLAFHLNENLDVASRKTSFIDKSVAWLVSRFGLDHERHVIDFGCGPGLYTARLARLGAVVTGVDFSTRSIDYARAYASRHDLRINYQSANYLEFDTPGRFDLILMIMCDYCALSPRQRATMLEKFGSLLSLHGRIVLDVYSHHAFRQREESSTYAKNLMNGFWSPHPYYGFLNVIKYEAEKVVLDKYTIVEQQRTREVYNWLQYFSVETIEQEFNAAGLEIEEVLSDVAGEAFDAEAPEFAVVVRGSDV